MASRAIYEAVFETVRHGTRTADLGGNALTDQFTGAGHRGGRRPSWRSGARSASGRSPRP